jgi:hypothetical protein
VGSASRTSSWLAFVAVTWLAILIAADHPAAQRGRTPADVQAPPLSMTCPMHPDIVEAKAGSCPLCRMSLVPVRLESVWTCPVHSVIQEHDPGRCRLCRRDLIQVTVAFTWSCLGRPDIDQIDRGTCPDGSPMIPKRTLRPHGNHNPQHGGQFFMAPDNWHHIEGTYPRDRVFRLFIYDDYARPLAADKMRQVVGRVVTKESFDAATRTTKELSAFPLTRTRNGYLEARLDPASLPARMTARLRLKKDGPEYRFDFTFPAYSTDTSAPVTTRTAQATPRAAAPEKPASTTANRAPATAPGASPDANSAAAVAAAFELKPDPGLLQVEVPEAIPEIVRLLNARKDQIRELIDGGNFAAVFVPAFQAKDLAIALEARLDTLDSARRQVAEPAIRSLVRTAWLLDAVGDVGNKQQLVDAFTAFEATVSAVTSSFAPGP